MDHITQRQLFLSHVAQTSDMPFMGYDMNIKEARGSLLIDINGKEYIDFISGISVSTIGHCHPKVVEAIGEQSKKFMHLMVYGEFNQAPQVQYAKRLSHFLPDSLNSIYFTTGGSEAVEGAMKLAKRATGRSEIISFKNAYHGSTQGSLSLMSDENFKNSFRPLLPGISHYEYNSTSFDYITENTAAVFVESIQGEAGVIIADKNFISGLRKRCDETGTLLVFDEIQTGFGRTGKMFAFEWYNVIPDILCVAKGMGGGLPIGAFIAKKELMSSLSYDPILGHINTFGGNAVCVKAAHATLDVLDEEKLAERAYQIEAYLVDNLIHPKIKQLRIKGALGAIQFESEGKAFTICRNLIENGLVSDWFLFNSSSLRIAPPLVITDKELEKSVSIILKVLNES